VVAGIVADAEESFSVERIATLETVDANTVEEGFAAILAHNIGLLSAFVGEDLVLPLVQEAWDVSVQQ
jgi:hypothetical protein